ncbi:hypothetical protein Poli38472_004540 [Pythium oligandrum]|uniref:Uncharacterized protein n=1 Tax=Pythium oligandrum TaxID=41045 RepID=A0A8K1CAN1_PYTOL|nr:hypothetical protein Poli38472_004540 [Pythium oligandrum]|eukprot:TMW59471.1 hypothetical protein Poli38472_004540 [Pythium oligandrum]
MKGHHYLFSTNHKQVEVSDGHQNAGSFCMGKRAMDTMDTWWMDVEADVEKNRHVKDPFREAYVRLVGTPFDRFLENEGRGDDGNEGRADELDPVALRHEISIRSQQVHLRLEILRRQVHTLCEESEAFLSSRNRREKASSRSKQKTPEDIPQEIAADPVIDVEQLLHRLQLFEKGELSSSDIQKSWQWNCDCESHEVARIDGHLNLLRQTMNERFIQHLETRPSIYGPLQTYTEMLQGETSDEQDDPAFLQECMKSIKPFFLEDFIQEDFSMSHHSDNQEEFVDVDEPMDVDDECDIAQAESPVERATEASPVLGASCEVPRECEEVSPPNPLHSAPSQPRDCISSPRYSVSSRRQSNNLFSVEKTKAKRDTFRAEAQQVEPQETRPTTNPRQEAIKSSRSTIDEQNRQLLVDCTSWLRFSHSILDPGVDLLSLRESGIDGDEDAEPGVLNIQYSRDVSVMIETRSTISVEDVPRLEEHECDPLVRRDVCDVLEGDSQYPYITKRQRGSQPPKPSKKPKLAITSSGVRRTTLRMLIDGITLTLRRVAQTSCVSYLSSIAKTLSAPASPQRHFVALVFAASIANTSDREHDAEKISITLESARSGDVKVICRQE